MTAPTNQHHACTACDNPATHQWQRHATPEELHTFRNDPNNPNVQPHETSALVPVMACDDHALPDDLAAWPHQADCPAPTGECACFTDGVPA